VAAPYQTVSGSYSIRFDDALNYVNESNGITLHNVSLPISPASLVFSYSNLGPRPLTVGGSQNGAGLQLGTTDFFHVISNPGAANPFSLFVVYTAPGYFFSPFVTGQTQLSFVELAAVPEPATWMLLIGGFFMIGYTLRRKNNIRTAVSLQN
jgi:PEP-CTERM motif